MPTYARSFAFTFLSCAILFSSSIALGSVESSLLAIQNKLINVILPLAGILGVVFAAFSFFTGNPNARSHLFLAMVGAAIGFGAPSITCVHSRTYKLIKLDRTNRDGPDGAFPGGSMSLKTTPVSRCLDKKLQIAGYEIPDLLVIFFLLSILNFLFGRTDMKLLLIWLPTVALAATLRIGKRGKPDNYLVHWVRFKLRRKELFAFPEPSTWPTPPTANGEKINDE